MTTPLQPRDTGWLPKPTGCPSERVEMALQLYRRLWITSAEDERPELRTMCHGLLNGLLIGMEKQELAHYYAEVRKLNA